MAEDYKIDADFSGLEKLIKKLKNPGHVDIGYLGGKTDTESGKTIAGIAAIHEFGSIEQNIPERSTVLMPLTVKQKAIQKAAQSVLQQALEEQDTELVLKRIGIAGEAAIKEAYETGGFGKWEPLQDETIRRKGSSRILIDEGIMRNSVTSKVEKGK